jgi:hypothetical protein
VAIICTTKKIVFWFKRKYLVQSKDFSEKYGGGHYFASFYQFSEHLRL